MLFSFGMQGKMEIDVYLLSWFKATKSSKSSKKYHDAPGSCLSSYTCKLA